MEKSVKVLQHLIPSGGWTIYGGEFDSIVYDEGVTPITKKQFDDTYKIIDKLLETEAKSKMAQRQAILDRLGLSADEAQLLLG